MARLDNWQTNLSALIDKNRDKPFFFPMHNCGLWAMQGMNAVNGSSLINKYIDKCSNETAAALAMRKLDNVETTEALLAKYLGEFQPIAFARQGDIVFYSPTGVEHELPADLRLFGPVPGICYGAISYFLGEHGLVALPTLQLDKTLWVS